MDRKIWTCRLLERDFQTDDVRLFQILAGDPERLAKDYPGFHTAVIQSMKLLDEQRLRAKLITYFNYRVQAWALGGFDADPTPPIRVVPLGELMDPNGPVTFSRQIDAG